MFFNGKAQEVNALKAAKIEFFESGKVWSAIIYRHHSFSNGKNEAVHCMKNTKVVSSISTCARARKAAARTDKPAASTGISSSAACDRNCATDSQATPVPGCSRAATSRPMPGASDINTACGAVLTFMPASGGSALINGDNRSHAGALMAGRERNSLW